MFRSCGSSSSGASNSIFFSVSISIDGLLAPRDLERFRSAAPSPASIDDFDLGGRVDVSGASFAAVIATGRDTANALRQGLRAALSRRPGRS